MNYWWKKFQEDDGKISDPSVYPQHALSADPKVTLQSLEVLTTRTRESAFNVEPII